MKSGYSVTITRDHSRMVLDLTELTDSELRVFIASETPKMGWGGMVYELIKQMRDPEGGFNACPVCKSDQVEGAGGDWAVDGEEAHQKSWCNEPDCGAEWIDIYAANRVVMIFRGRTGG